MRPEVKMPASELLEAAVNNPQAFQLGRKLNSIYGSLASRKRYDEAKVQAEEFLSQFAPDQRLDILRGAIVSAHLNGTQCGVIWQWGPAGIDGKPRPGIRDMTIEALTKSGLQCRTTNSELVYYSTSPVKYFAIRLSSVWFFYYRRYYELKGMPVPDHYIEIPEPPQPGQEVVMLPDGTRRFTQVWAKKQIQGLVDRGQFNNRTVSLRKTNEGKFAVYNEEGVQIAFLSQKYSGGIKAECALVLRLPLNNDGNLICIVQYEHDYVANQASKQ